MNMGLARTGLYSAIATALHTNGVEYTLPAQKRMGDNGGDDRIVGQELLARLSENYNDHVGAPAPGTATSGGQTEMASAAGAATLMQML